MNKSQRIRTTLDGSDKYILVKLEQNVDFLEILSLKIDQEQAYQNFNSDYGVLVGRVIANGGVGVPNAKISIFIPLTDEDELNPKIKAIYPYKSPQDKNIDGKRYNLLPRVAKVSEDGTLKPKQPFGTFPPKEEVITNETYLEVYEKYYKFTTVTNNSGDYMIFGVPVGIQTVHMSVDITDIGQYSMTPAAMVTNLGYSPNLFTDNNTKIKSSNDLADLPHIETQEISVEVRPFWGDTENYEIGITRQDFRIRAALVNTFTIFGAIFTDGTNSVWGRGDSGSAKIEDFFRINDGGEGDSYNISIASKRITDDIRETIFYYPSRVSDDDIENELVDTEKDIFVLEKTEYSRIIEKGQFVYIINCNRKKQITSENGELIDVPDDSPNGIFTEFRGFITFQLSDENLLPIQPSGEIGNRPIRSIRNKIKVPQSALIGNAINKEDNGTNSANNEKWRKQNFTFKGGKIYSVAKYHSIHSITDSGNGEWDNLSRNAYFNAGIIMTGNFEGINNVIYDFPSNGDSGGNVPRFGGQWLNFCLHLGQQGYTNRDEGDRRTNYYWTANQDSSHFTNGNNQLVAANVRDTSGFYRNDFHQTTFIEVPKQDILNIWNNIPNRKGFTSQDIFGLTLTNYKNGPVNGSGGRVDGLPANPIDPDYYFYRGFDTADCIEFLIRLGIV